MEAERRELKEKGNGMDISERKKYGSDNEVEECPKCGCKHFEVVNIATDKHSITFRVTCRYCGNEIRRTVGIDFQK